MKNKNGKLKFTMLTVAVSLLFTACSNANENHSDTTATWDNYKNFYTISVKNTGEDESTEKYLEIAERSQKLFPLLEENVGAFVMDAYNYQDIDGEGTPLYTMNTLNYPQEIDPNGESIRVSKYYFKYNPIKTTDGTDLTAKIKYDDMTLNVLVPEKYQDKEDQIMEAYLDKFYFEKVQATNDYNEEIEKDSKLEIPKENLNINIIYVENGQKYFTFRSDCAVQTDNWIEDPIVQIYTSNIHCNYAHSFMTQWIYYYSDQDTAEKAYQEIEKYVKECGAEQSIQKVVSINE